MGKSAGLPCLVHRLEPGDLAVELGQVLPELPEPLRRAHRFFVALDLVGQRLDGVRQGHPARGHRRARAVGR
jgi:hypothetical protein